MGLSINKMFNNILSIMTYPFQKGLRLLVVVFVFSSLVECIGFGEYENTIKAIYIAMHHAVIAYVIVLFEGLINNGLKQIYRIIIWIFLFANFFIDLVCVYSFHFTFDQEVPAIILGTNSSEAIEFINVFLPLKFWILLIIGVGGIYLMSKCLKFCKLSLPNQLANVAVLCVFCFFSLTIILNSKNWGNISITKIVAFTKASQPVILENYQCEPLISYLESSQPEYVVLIIGESFSKYHSSIYGYKLDTNPLLSQLIESGNLYVYDNVTSPALNTIPVFKTMMSTYKLEYGESINWYECPTIPMIMRAANYRTCWFSNQSQKGFHDNVIAQYASLCDTSFFSGNRFAAMGKSDLDGDLIPIIDDYVRTNLDGRQFHVIHLMGSHPDFTKRYPDEFQVFASDDYLEALPKQRESLASYDNSILYNDYVVSQLINIYKDKEAIIIYLSDHGLDVYDSRDDYVGHSRDNDLKSAKVGYDIPYMVYVTHTLKSNRPELIERIYQEMDTPFCIDNMVQKLMDIIGVSFNSANEGN